MFAKGNSRWIVFVVAALAVASAGLWLGKTKEKDLVDAMYARTDFTLLDDENEFFHLKEFPKEKLLLLVFTPDHLDPELVPTFRDFAAHRAELARKGVEVMLVTRTNREVARNFKRASHFTGRLLTDNSGTVGRNVGIWPDFQPVTYWGYAVVDAGLHVYWTTTEHRPLTFEEVSRQLEKLK